MDLITKPLQTAPAAHTQPERQEQKIAWGLMLVLVLVRVAYVFRFRIDSDEPQHLHVVWNWTQGLLPYRDFFDNHTPLFHLLCSPLLKLVGERADALNLMRLAMVPLYGVVLWAVYRIARQLFSRRVALWAPLIAGIFPNYFFPAVEFRTDNLWAPVWLVALVILIEGQPGLLRWLFAGVVIGTAFAVSMKTSVLAVTLLGATVVAATICPGVRQKPVRSLLFTLAALAGMVLVPSALVYYLYSQGAYEPFKYCVIAHNVLPANLIPHRPKSGILWFLLMFIGLWFGARQIYRKAPNPSVGTRRTIIFLQTTIFLSVMNFLWPEVTRQDYLPVYPLAAMLLTPVLVMGADWVRNRLGSGNLQPAWSGSALFVVGLIWLLIARPITLNGTLSEVHLLDEALRLTKPGEYVMSFKGEAVFRPHPFFYVLEPFARIRLYHGLLKDTIAESMIATKTCVAMTNTHRMPKKGEQFIQQNYLPVGQLRVVGKELGTSPKEGAGTLKFEVVIPTDYVLLSGSTAANGTLDGTPYTGPRQLQAGPHEFQPVEKSTPVTLFWSRAFEGGFLPRPKDFTPERVGSEF